MPVEGRSHRPGTRRPPNPATSSPPRSIIPTRSSRRFVITWRDGLFLGVPTAAALRIIIGYIYGKLTEPMPAPDQDKMLSVAAVLVSEMENTG